MKILKSCMFLVGLLLGTVGGTYAQIIVENADTVWDPTVESSAFHPGPIGQRFIIENANTIYHNDIDDIDSRLVAVSTDVPPRIMTTSAKTMFTIVLTPMISAAIVDLSGVGRETSVELTWTNQRSDELPNTLVVSSPEKILWRPETGIDFTVGDVIEELITIRYVGDVDHTATPLTIGDLEANTSHHFAAFPFDAEKNYALGTYVSVRTEEGGIPRWDVNEDGIVNLLDLILVASHFGERTIPAAMAAMGISMSDREQILDLLEELEVLENPPDGMQVVIDFLRSLLNPEPVIRETKLLRRDLFPKNGRSPSPRRKIMENLSVFGYNKANLFPKGRL